MPVEHLRMQYAVGQGGFHAAYVKQSEEGVPGARFDYVYDCGALEGQGPSKALKHALNHFEPRQARGVSRVDALVLSHFDYDHIIGASGLAKKHRVTRVFVPFLSEDQLIAEFVKTASHATEETLEALLAAAHGGRLWGAEVIQVSGGGAGPGGPEQVNRPPDEPMRARRIPPDENPNPLVLGDLVPRVSRTGAPLPAVLRDDEPVGLYSSTGVSVWRLKFWNYQFGELVELVAEEALKLAGFPTTALRAPSDTSAVVSWLRVKKNRDAANGAYRKALQRCYGNPVSEKEVPNLSSLALYSGPEGAPPPGSTYWNGSWGHHGCGCWFCPELQQFGWIGAGDAPLGEAHVWQDFSRHFHHELSQTRTVLVPHHGAAPRSGRAFYNRGLNPDSGVVTVISAGANNTYGHPRPSVLSEILELRGELHVVTEHSWPGLMERVYLP